MSSAARFVDKVAIVTGAATGIGRATLARLASEGATLLAVDVNVDALAESADQARSAAGRAGRVETVVASITDEAAIKSAFAGFAERQGKLDVLINVAGVLRAVHSVEETLEDFVRILQIIWSAPFCAAARRCPISSNRRATS